MPWEVRWFFSGEIPHRTSSWFSGLGKVPETRGAARDDYQVWVPPECDCLGIKLREGRLEIKWRNAAEPAFSACEGRVEGVAESWRKWMLPAVDGLGSSFMLQKPEGPTVRISKARAQRRYELLQDGSLAPSQKEWIPAGTTGCTLELTSITLQDNAWWSLAFETLGNENFSLLQQAADELLRSYSGPRLERNNSCGYPRWLAGNFSA